MRLDLTVFALAGLLIVGGAGVVVAGPALGLSGDAGVTESEIAGFQAGTPFCASERPTNGTTALSPLPGGERMRINDTIDVDRTGTTVEPHLNRFGPDRYVLDLSRQPGGEPADCDLVVRYEVRLNLSTATGYTVVLTEDDRMVGSYWSEPGVSGGSQVARADPPERTGAGPDGVPETEATEASDAGSDADGGSSGSAAGA